MDRNIKYAILLICRIAIYVFIGIMLIVFSVRFGSVLFWFLGSLLLGFLITIIEVINCQNRPDYNNNPIIKMSLNEWLNYFPDHPDNWSFKSSWTEYVNRVYVFTKKTGRYLKTYQVVFSFWDALAFRFWYYTYDKIQNEKENDNNKEEFLSYFDNFSFDEPNKKEQEKIKNKKNKRKVDENG